jgi:hypothetical protein
LAIIWEWTQTTYKGVLETSLGKSEIEIKNDFEHLEFEIDNFKFIGTSFDDFELLNYENYSKSELKNFSFNKIRFGNGFSYELCDCKLTVNIPIQIKDIENEKVFTENLEMKVETGKSIGNGMTEDVKVSLNLKIFDKNYSAVNFDFENGANEIKSQLEPKYKFINCFGCSFSDYSPYGKAIFGTMLCFKNKKEEYLKVKSKDGLFDLGKEDRIVQEIYQCSEYEPRGINVGYRG